MVGRLPPNSHSCPYVGAGFRYQSPTNMSAKPLVPPNIFARKFDVAISGYASAYFARQLHPVWVRYFIICVGFSMTIYFFLHKGNQI